MTTKIDGYSIGHWYGIIAWRWSKVEPDLQQTMQTLVRDGWRQHDPTQTAARRSRYSWTFEHDAIVVDLVHVYIYHNTIRKGNSDMQWCTQMDNNRHRSVVKHAWITRQQGRREQTENRAPVSYWYEHLILLKEADEDLLKTSAYVPGNNELHQRSRYQIISCLEIRLPTAVDQITIFCHDEWVTHKYCRHEDIHTASHARAIQLITQLPLLSFFDESSNSQLSRIFKFVYPERHQTKRANRTSGVCTCNHIILTHSMPVAQKHRASGNCAGEQNRAKVFLLILPFERKQEYLWVLWTIPGKKACQQHLQHTTPAVISYYS